MIASSVYSSLYVGAIYSKPWDPEATDSVDLFYSQWLLMQAAADRAHFVSFTLLLHGPGCSDGQYRCFCYIYEQLCGGLLCSGNPYLCWIPGFRTLFKPLQHQLT